MPKLIIVNGLSASGKSTLAARLSKDLNTPLFAKDDFKELIADTIGYTNHESTRHFGKASFAALFLVAQEILSKGTSVVIEGNFTLGEETKSFLSHMREGEIDVREILCYTNPELLIRRYRDRTKHPERHPVHHTLGEKELNEWVDRIFAGNGKAAPLTGNLLEVDTTNLTDEQYKNVLDFVDA
jgi:glucokinase